MVSIDDGYYLSDRVDFTFKAKTLCEHKDNAFVTKYHKNKKF